MTGVRRTMQKSLSSGISSVYVSSLRNKVAYPIETPSRTPSLIKQILICTCCIFIILYLKNEFVVPK